MAPLALVLTLACAHPVAPPTSWTALQQDLPKDKGKRARVLFRFVRDDSSALDDRLRAARALFGSLAPTDPKRVDAAVAEAELFAVAGKRGQRRGALLRARADARRLHQDGKAAQLERALDGDVALRKLERFLDHRRGAGAEPASVKSAADAVDDALPSWLALGDERAHGAARIALARRQALTDADAAARALGDAVDALGTGRDAAAVRADGWRAMARLAEDAGRLEDAAAAALAADRADAVNPRVAAAPVTAPEGGAAAPRYTRSRDTAALCGRLRDKGVSCAKVEMKRWGARTFYDFSRERSGGFNRGRADDVLHEYESLLQGCLQQGARKNLTTNTHVELEWGVGNDGHVLQRFDLRPMRLRGSLVESCLTGAFAAFRYPRYRGEMQHVRLSYDVGE